MAATLNVRAIRLPRTEAEYEAPLAEAERLVGLDPDPESDEGLRLVGLSLLIGEYEAKHYAVDGLTRPQDAVDFALDQHDLTRADLAEVMGGKSRVSEFFSGKRELSKAQMLALHARLGIPLQLLF